MVAPLFGGSGNAAGGMIMPPKGVQGCPPGESLVTFFSKRKSPGVEGRSALPMGAVGAEGPHFGERRGGQHLWCTPSHRGPQGPRPS